MSPERKISTPDVYGLFTERPEVLDCLKKAEDMLRQVERGEILFNKVREFLDATGMRETLTKPSAQLDNLTPMAFLRQKVKQETSSQQSRKTISSNSYRSPRRESKIEPLSHESQQLPRSHTIYDRHFLSKGTIVTEREDLASINEDTEFVHLGHQEVINIKTIKALLNQGVKIKTIQIPNSQKRLIGPGVKKLLEQHGIELRTGRVRNIDYYDEPQETKEYLEKKRFWQNAVINQQKAAILTRLKENEFEEVEMASIYFEEKSASKTRLPIRAIAEKFGLPHNVVNRKVSGLLCLLGVEYKDARTNSRARELTNTLNRLEAARISQEKQEELRRGFSVGDLLPPQTLKPSRWETWQKIELLNQSNPELLNQLHENHPRWHTSLAHYFQLENPGTVKISARRFGKQHFGVTGERIRQYKNKALGFLGLLE